MSRRTPRWPGASSRCSSPSRRSRTRSRSCAASRRNTSCITACASPTAAIVAAATLSNRYIADRFLPDKAIDLVDEAASRLRMQVDSKPEELDELDRRIIQLKIEQEALKKRERCALARPTDPARGRARRPAGEIRRADGALALREGQARLGPEAEGAARSGAHRTRAGAAPRRVPARRRTDLRGHPRPREAAGRGRGQGRRPCWSTRR